MSLGLGNETLTFLRRSAPKDAFGDPAPGSADIETDVSGCNVQPDTTDEQTDRRDTVIDVWKAWAPTADMDADRIRWRGDIYQIIGRPEPWADLDSRDDHIELKMRRVRG